MNLLSTYMRSRGDYSPSLLNRTGPGGVRAEAGLNDRPLHAYLDEDEIPHYVLETASAPTIERAGDRIEHRNGSFATFVVATDDRVICVSGGPDGDAVVTIPYSELTAVEAETRRKMVSKSTAVSVRGEHASIEFETNDRNTIPAMRAFVGEQIASHYLDEAHEHRESSRKRREEPDLEAAEVDLTDASYAIAKVLEFAPNGSAVRERAEELSEDLESDAHRLSRAKEAEKRLDDTETALADVEEAARAGDYDAIPEYHDAAEEALEEAMDTLDPADTFTKAVARERKSLRDQQAQLTGVDTFEDLLGTLEEAREAHDRYEVAMDDGDLDTALDALGDAREGYADYVDMLPQSVEPTDEGCVRCDNRPAAFDIETPDGTESVCLPCTAFDDQGALPRGEEITQRLAALPDVDALPESLPEASVEAESGDEPAVEPDEETAPEVETQHGSPEEPNAMGEPESEIEVETESGAENGVEANAEPSAEQAAEAESEWSERETAMLAELEAMQEERGGLLRAHDLRGHDEYNAQDYIATFGSWDEALLAAGIDKEARLLGELQRVTDKLGHKPTKLEMSRHGQYSFNMYERFFGEWDAAKTRLDDWHRTQSTAAGDEESPQPPVAESEPESVESESDEPESAESESEADADAELEVETAEPTEDVDEAESDVESAEPAPSESEPVDIESDESETAESENAETPLDVEVVEDEPVHPEPSGSRPTAEVSREPEPVSDGGTTAASASAAEPASETSEAEDEDDERESMKNDLQDLEAETDGVPSRDDVVVGSDHSLLRYEVVFGSLEDALDEAGIDRERLFSDDLEAVREEVGTLPSRQQFARYGDHGISQIVAFFGSWDDALESVFDGGK